MITLVILLCAGGISLAAWRIADNGDDGQERATGEEDGTFQSDLESTTAPDGAISGGEESGDDVGVSSLEGTAEGQSGEDLSYTSPDQRYVSEIQRHQNFFKALAEGEISRLDVTSTDYQPVGDPNTSYVYFTVATDSGSSDGTFVMKYEGGLWRIAAVNQLQGDLGGGTNYMVPDSFEDDLAREIRQLQEFLTKVAEGRLAYMTVNTVNRVGECEVVLSGVVVSKGGRTEPAEMRLRKDYGLWHITDIQCL